MGIAQRGGGGFRSKRFRAGWNVMPPKPCDYCKSAAALFFCRVDSAFMCMACDSEMHGLKTLPLKHERVWMCEVCEQAPAAVTCKADAAALCVTCDSDIHSANPLSRRHERSPVVPFYETAESAILKSTAASLPVHKDASGAVFAAVITNHERNLGSCVAQECCNIADSWVCLSPIASSSKLSENACDMKMMEYLLSDSDPFLDFDPYPISTQPFRDSLVPIQTTIKTLTLTSSLTDDSPGSCFELDFKSSSINSFNHHSVNKFSFHNSTI